MNLLGHFQLCTFCHSIRMDWGKSSLLQSFLSVDPSNKVLECQQQLLTWGEEKLCGKSAVLTLVHFDPKPVGTNRKKFILMLMVWLRTYIIIHLKPDIDKTSAKRSSETIRIKFSTCPFFLIPTYQDEAFLFKARTCLCFYFLNPVREGVSGLLFERR